MTDLVDAVGMNAFLEACGKSAALGQDAPAEAEAEAEEAPGRDGSIAPTGSK